MKKGIFGLVILTSISCYAGHEMDERINQIKSLTPVTVIKIMKGTETTLIGDKCLLVHEKLNKDLELSTNNSLVIEDIFSRIRENAYGITSGYMKHSVSIQTSGVKEINGLICEAGEAKRGGTIAYASGRVDAFAYNYSTTFEDLALSLQSHFQIEEGERDARPVFDVSARSKHIWGTEQEHSRSAYSRFTNMAEKKCEKEGFPSYRVLNTEWKSGINVSKYKLKGQIKCLN